ncbi:hypothetical protein HELRODRAFT_170384 [Helobdella robusta]|uniref:G-protein coupled receptors family 1 profile domain-containing protein n=1 Tax=Helobdella robusta TaxID=6412 RepID=T1F2Z5_HELRO|nr:hypothetical protein HELRODRAFT_170384 [Helobdella robusta]ESO07825.1 hypothetical protein HELRODRAFT_170384 [Helobdella robusta]
MDPALEMADMDMWDVYQRMNEKQKQEVLFSLNMTLEEFKRFSYTNAAYVNQLTKHLLLYVTPILLVFGLVGNFLSFLVLTRKSMRIISAYLYLIVLSVVDTVVLCIGFIKLWIPAIRTDLDIRLKYDSICRLTNALGSTVSDFSVWLIVAVTVERYVVVCHPLKRSNVCRRKFSQTFHALKTLRSHGLRGFKLFDITESLIISPIKYAALSWSGFATQHQLQQLQSLIKKLIRLNYLHASYPAVTQIFNTLDSRLLKKVNNNNNNNHVTHLLLPTIKTTTHNFVKASITIK